MLLFYGPALEGLVVGQTNLVVLAGVVLFLTRDRPTPQWIGAIGLAAAISIKLTPAFVLVVSIARRDWMSVVRVIIGVIALMLASIGLYGWTLWASFASVLPSLAVGDRAWVNVSPPASIGRLTHQLGASDAIVTGPRS